MVSFDPVLDYLGSFLLFLLVFGMSATVNINQMKKQIKNRRAILTCLLLQFVMLPFLGFVCVKILNLSNIQGIMLLVITSSPGGSYSNWWCSLFNADLALSVAMTAISTVVSMVIMPLNLILYSKFTFDADVVDSLDWSKLIISLMIVTLGIGLGLTCSAYAHSTSFNVVANKLGNYAGLFLVVFSLAMSSTSAEARLWNFPWYFYSGIALPCILALIFGNIITSLLSLDEPERVTISIETCYQNVGIASSLALTMFNGKSSAEAMGVPLYYGIVEAVVLGIYCIICWKAGWTKAPPTDPFWKVITTSYEVITYEKHELREIEISIADITAESLSGSESQIHCYVSLDEDEAKKKRFNGLCLCGNLANVADNDVRIMDDYFDKNNAFQQFNPEDQFHADFEDNDFNENVKFSIDTSKEVDTEVGPTNVANTY